MLDKGRFPGAGPSTHTYKMGCIELKRQVFQGWCFMWSIVKGDMVEGNYHGRWKEKRSQARLNLASLKKKRTTL